MPAVGELGSPVSAWRCRWCGAADGVVVIDLGDQPAADHFPGPGDTAVDPRYPLRMVMCAVCRLAQLEDDPTVAEEPRGVEPQALVDQARQAVADLVAAALARPGGRVVEFTSPHGGHWSDLLRSAGLRSAPEGMSDVDLVVDSLGLMHAADQREAWAERVERLSPDGILAVHVHTMGSILRHGMWNVLRHGHFAYYSVPVLYTMAAEFGLAPVAAWEYPLYGGTTVIAFARRGAAPNPTPHEPARHRAGLLADRERAAGTTDPLVVAGLGRVARGCAGALREFLDEAGRQGVRVAAYSAASRSVALLGLAGAGPEDILAVGDSAPIKHGRAIPGSRIPVVSPDEMAGLEPDRVLLFVPDLLPEVRAALPEIEGRGARWVVIDPIPVEVTP